MSIPSDIQQEQEAWKTYYIARGLPEAMLNEMIAEANLEYEAELGFPEFDRLAQLTVNINDSDLTLDCFYVIFLVSNNQICQGTETYEQNYIFAQVPCVPWIIYVIKIKSDNTQAVAMGIKSINHSKDESITITVNKSTVGNTINVNGLTALIQSAISIVNLSDVLHATILTVIEVIEPTIRTINIENQEYPNLTYTITDINGNPITEIADGTPFNLNLTNVSVTWDFILRCTRTSDSLQIIVIPQLAYDFSTMTIRLVQYENCTWRLTD
jgi:hypothetical protein